ncbi:MAG: DNA primase [Methylococcaceae bacterium]
MNHKNMSAGRIPREFIDDLLVRVDIVDLIDSHLPLKKTGNNYVACCPFHTEKTPSFSVNRNKGFYHCFGCGVSGNAISFLMEFNHLDFVEAIEDLAHFAGVDVEREASTYEDPSQPKENLTKLYALMQQIESVYKTHLKTNELAKNYLKNRGVSGEIAKQFNLGYAPDAWQTLTNQFDQQDLFAVGMAVRSDEGKVYDRFRKRVMFPIRNKRGQIIGFGGRVLDNSLPKYLNSPETTLFHKGSEVYGLYELLQKNAKPARILVVEGYMDVIALAQFGIDYAVATLGTATSQTHLDLLFRFSSELVFCFDGDNAGQTAAWRVMDSAFSSLRGERQIRIMLLPTEHDPDSLIREEGLEKFNERVTNAQILSDYFFGHLEKQLNLNELEGRARLVDKAKTYLEKLPQGTLSELMFKRLNALAGTDIADSSTILEAKQHKNLIEPQSISLPRRVMANLIQKPSLINYVEQNSIDWQNLNFTGATVFKAILQKLLKEKPKNTAVLLESYRGHRDEKIVNELAALDLLIINQPINEQGIEKEFSDALQKLCAKPASLIDEHKLQATSSLSDEEKALLLKSVKR